MNVVGDAFIGLAIAVFILRMIAWMIQNVKNGKSLCGFTMEELLDLTENKKQG